MVSLGIDQLLASGRLAGQKVGLISNYAMVDGHLVPVIDRLLADSRVRLTRLFGPEHGVLNAAPEGQEIPHAADAHSGVEAVSLYGEQKAPPRELLADLDALIVDLQDIGTRYYTNASTLYYAIEAAQGAALPLYVLDRPNPLGGLEREGAGLDPAYRSFVGMMAVPIRHGLTFGEIARVIQATEFPGAPVEVMPMGGWRREMLWPETGLPFVSASPNTTQFDMTLLYPGTCLLEGTNVSVGRGTTHPFEWLGAPWVDGHRLARWVNDQNPPGVRARPVYFAPWRSLYQGELVGGIQLHVIDPHQVSPLALGVLVLQGLLTLYPDKFVVGSDDDHPRRPFFDLLAGGPQLREALISGSIETYWEAARAFLAEFNRFIESLLIY